MKKQINYSVSTNCSNKIFIKFLFIIISFFLLVGGVSVGAATYFKAKDVEFIPSNSEWNVTNVEEAINELYEKASYINTDEKKYIIKDGVLQDGYELILDNATSSYDATKKGLLIKKTNTTYMGRAIIPIDVTDYKEVGIDHFPYVINNGHMWSLFVFLLVENSYTKNVDNVTSFIDKHSSCNVSNVEDLTGMQNIIVSGYYYDSIDTYSFYIKNLWVK